MKRIIVVIVALALLATTTRALAMRCGRNLVSEGDHKYQVLAACGQPAVRERVGIDNKRLGEYRIVEEWLYIINEYGHQQMYLLRFDGEGRLREIEWLGEKQQ
ncbi:MAG: DUF2845 domain-containing protein [Deltaproteobacteria bacterium]|nr:DUF2845 domain-containing protein [Deltaproteobacteria bacterium]